MRIAEPVSASWTANLSLEFQSRAGRTVLAARRHDGPLVVQKPLYPEGGEVCHVIVVHPPGGIVGGDELQISLGAGAGAHALLTTPGAGKWYRTAGPRARQRIEIEVAAGAVLEWLPQETIVFDGAAAHLSTRVRLAAEAGFLGWEIVCLGRAGSGERFTRGTCRLETEIRLEGRLAWRERGRIEGGGALLEADAGLAGATVCGTLCASFPGLGAAQLAACREARSAEGETGVTLLPGVLLARYLGDSGESARRYFEALWRALRPALAGREAREPRIWRT